VSGGREEGNDIEFIICSDDRGTVGVGEGDTTRAEGGVGEGDTTRAEGGVGEGDATRADGGVKRSFLPKPALDPGGEKFNLRGVKPDRVGDDGAARCLSGFGLEGTGIGGIAGTGGI
jgi:hypothetical protein